MQRCKNGMKLDDLRTLIAIAQHGSFRAAASALDIPPTTLSRRLQRLEDTLGSQLVIRDSRNVSLTPLGRNYFERCQPLLTQLETATAELHDSSHSEPRGALRISAPVGLLTYRLMPLFNQFLALYPEISLSLTHLSNQHHDYSPEQYDVVFRVGQQPDSSFAAANIGASQRVLVASPDYLTGHGSPIHPDEINEHSRLASVPEFEWALTNKMDSQETIWINSPVKMAIADLNSIKQATIEGLGIACLPNYVVADALATGQLSSMMDNWYSPPRPIYMLYQRLGYVPAHIQIFTDFMRDALDNGNQTIKAK
ncbi:LysR family transcriptional regulator [Photobacterium sp. ZSDE20]|uniref:LysR family transcriptional regulator n=1 Tax=Photobacterium pectinilyticum TaxID=2906793 RepID=A0ABT1N6N6_9GAMM|nr:LysR family transcriptional regulator [Photobacterium sp. ZSDE20]MCQ1059366.1 LysR family transcriptional regulator [Photobacterium sp. ZSDE20]MDD1825070.1 LysR family transcriptional regulator [Photobacterium sp. ZSDE20]